MKSTAELLFGRHAPGLRRSFQRGKIVGVAVGP